MKTERRQFLTAGTAAVALLALGRWAGAEAQERVLSVVARKFVFLPNEITLKLG